MNEMTATKKLAKFVYELEFDHLSSEVQEHLHFCLLDAIGCGIYGSTKHWSQKVIKTFEDIVPKSDNQGAKIFGHSTNYTPDHAALINGTLIHCFEFDDLHKTAVIHPGAEIIPVLLALTDYLEMNGRNVTGKEFLTALAAGYEVGCHVGMLTGAEQLNRGFHPSATSGIFGAAAAGAKLLNLSEEEILHSIGIAGSQASGLMSAQYEAMVKRMNPGKAAQNGLLSVMLAKNGFTGITNVIEASYGGFAQTFADVHIKDTDFDNLGVDFETLNVGFKPYPCCGSNHTTIDCTLEMVKENGAAFKVEDIKEILIETTTATKHHVGWEYKASGAIAAQMNLQYATAVTLLDGECTVKQYEDRKIESENVNALIQKINIEPNLEFDKSGRSGRHHIRITTTFSDGTTKVKEKVHAKGSMVEPLTYQEVKSKFLNLVGNVYSEATSHALLDQLLTLETSSDVIKVFQIFHGELTKSG
ncbi:MmgE/PrpD family protein [Anaerobacillus sp. CMMVII]|uniref:MmgE/PrpD family protein n=1 Tax=Anaerobacillus sp. CMMVII TaxID=2755588 RepID=UPI0021B6F4DE|nr:MmgE/PrpD family protein [Anaerobacillus sp. CMMVII]MCT8140506.1 MmgE/PrpD family protein [Anaerobacillus sp. CMMVII]